MYSHSGLVKSVQWRRTFDKIGQFVQRETDADRDLGVRNVCTSRLDAL